MNKNKELVRLLREIEEVLGKLYSNTLQDKDLRLSKGAKRLAEEGASVDEAVEALKKEGLVLSAEERFQGSVENKKSREYSRLSLVGICFF